MMRRLILCLAAVVCFLPVAAVIAGDAPGSVGIQVVPISTGELSVLHVIDRSPAKQGGLLPGDLVVEVDGVAMNGSDFDLVTRKYLWGEVGTAVSLVWLRPGVAGEMRATLKRIAITGDLKIKSIPGVNIKTPN